MCQHCDQNICATVDNLEQGTYSYIEIDEDGTWYYVVRNAEYILHVSEIYFCPFCGREL